MTKRKPQTIEAKTSREWVYQHETFFKVILKNYVGELNEDDEEELKKEMLEALMNYRLKRYLKRKFGKNVIIEIQEQDRIGDHNEIVEAIVRKKPIRERISERFEDLKHHFKIK